MAGTEANVSRRHVKENQTNQSDSENAEAQDTKDEVALAENNDEVNTQEEGERPPPRASFAESFFAVTKSLIIRGLIIYAISSFFRRPQTDTSAVTTNGVPKVAAYNMFMNGTTFDLQVYLSESPFFSDFDNSEAKIWSENGLIYGDWYSGPDGDGTRTFSYSFIPSKRLLNNGSIYLHTYVSKTDKFGNSSRIAYGKKMLNKFKKIKYQKTHNLLTGQTQVSEETVKKAAIMDQEIVSHWHPNLTINLVTDQTNWIRGQVPAPLDEYLFFTSNGKAYKPVVYMNDFWNMQRDYHPLNNTIERLNLRLTYQPLSLFKWQIFASQSMKNKWYSSALGETDEESNDQDTLKETLLDTNPYLLGMTVFITILHSIFELLAFKNDIQFWNNRQSLEGLSVRSVFFNVFQSLVILLYVLDNETNTLVRISCGIGLAIEIWKINKVVDIRLNRESKLFGFIPKLMFLDKGSYVVSSTKDYDRLAFKYLSWALFPLLGGYAVYSLMYLEHKGWYSWVLNMLYGFLLTFGFIMMTPQLFINYKLKSVAHLPWRMMSYKFLNTFIDDIFAFVIKMPTLYRLGCFRDDIVFFIFLYQRWIYKIDRSRVNEFGFSGEIDDPQANNSETKAIEANTKDKNTKKKD